MDGYFSEKPLEPGATLYGDRAVDIFKSIYDEERSMVRICVEGYDTSLPVGDIVKALENHFESCGEIDDIEIPRERVTNVIKRCSFVVLRGEGAEEKALQLDGRDVGGWNVAVKVVPPRGMEFTTHQLAVRTVAHFRRKRSMGISVTGYDTELPGDVVKSFLSEHFSSCGFITDVFVLNRRALIYFYGAGAAHMALKLCGSDVGGRKLVAKALPRPKPKKTSCPDVPPGSCFL